MLAFRKVVLPVKVGGGSVALDRVLGHSGELAVKVNLDLADVAGVVVVAGSLVVVVLENHSVAVELDLSDICHGLLDLVPILRIVVLESLLIAHGLRLLDLDGDVVAVHGAAISSDHLKGLAEGIFSGLVEGDVGIDERNVHNLLARVPPIFRNILVPHHHTEDSGGGGRVAVGVLAAARGDVNGAVEVLVAVEKADEDVAAVDDGVDVELAVNPVRAADVVAVMFVEQSPGDVPVLRVLLVPFDDVGHRLVVVALCRDCLEGLVDDEADVVADECEREHRRDVNSTVPAVTVVHHVADAVRIVGCCVDHARCHQTGVVGLDLEVDVVGVRVVVPVAGLRRHHAVEDVVATELVGVPKRVRGVGECIGERLDWSVKAFLLEHFHESEVHVHVVEQARKLVEPPFDHMVVPRNLDFVVHEPGVLELGRSAVGAADDLSGPASLDLVHENLLGHLDLSGKFLGGRVEGGRHHDGAGGDEK